MTAVPEAEMAAPKCIAFELSEGKSTENAADFQRTSGVPAAATDDGASAAEATSAKAVLGALTICLGALIASATLDYPSPAIPNLNGNPNPFHVDQTQTSWVGSLAPLGALLGGLVGGPLMDAIGRKPTLLTCAGLMSVFLVVVVASSSLPCLLVGRALTGFVAGAYCVTCPIYVGEIAPASIRGLLGSCFMLASSIGTLYIYVLGAFLSWTWLAIAISAVNLAFIVAITFIPESPRWLLLARRREDAEFALRWLRGEGTLFRQELDMLQEALQQSQDMAQPWEFLRPALLKPLMVTLGLMLFHVFCGSKVVNMYTVQIFQMAKSGMDANVQTIVVGAMAFFGNLVCMGASDRVGRKALLLASGLTMTATMGGVGAFFYMLELNADYTTSTLPWLPMICLMVFNFGYGVAFGPIPFLVMSELFPPRAKGVASGISVASNWVMTFAMTKFFGNVVNAIHPYGAFWLCAAFCGLSFPFVVFCVPETKGKTLEELQDIFK